MTQPSSYSLAILNGLQTKSIYHGTVSEAESLKRIKVAKAAKIARRLNRK